MSPSMVAPLAALAVLLALPGASPGKGGALVQTVRAEAQQLQTAVKRKIVLDDSRKDWTAVIADLIREAL